MQLLRTLVILASVSNVSLASEADETRPHKKHERTRKQTAAGRRSLRTSRSSAFDDDDNEWAIQEGMLHLEAAEVETEAVKDIAAKETEDEHEEHPELAQAEDREKVLVEGQAAQNWQAVAVAAQAEAVQLSQGKAPGAAPAGAAPASAPAAPADFSWAHKMEAAKPLQEQGFDGPMIQHVDFDTMTEDWHKEHVQSWSTIKELCAVCERHPDNTWCKGKCPGTFEKLGDAADGAAADAATATENGGKSLEDKMGLPSSDGMPGNPFEKEGGILGKSGATERGLGGLIVSALLLQQLL